MQSPPPYVPFVEYVLQALEHPPYMYVAKLAACCTMLFLTRENPELLQELCHKWAIRFADDRLRLVRHIRKRASYCISSLDITSELRCDVQYLNEDASDDGCAAHPSDDRAGECYVAAGMVCCDPDRAVEHLLSFLNTLVPMYFSWNWHRADYVIQINKEYEVYVREYVLPMCAKLAPEEGVDDIEQTPWLLPPHTYLQPTESVSSFQTPTSTMTPYPCARSLCRPSSITGISVASLGAAATNQYPVVTPSGSAKARDADMEALTSPSLHQHFLFTTDTKGKISPSIVAAPLPSTSPTFDKTTSEEPALTSTPNMLSVSAQACSSAMSGASHLVISPNVISARAFNAAAVCGLSFLTLSNYREALQNNTQGLVIVFHAKYSAKSNEVIDMFQTITAKRLLDPMPTIAVVYAVAEPELSSLYKVGWFPTIVYRPPPRLQKRDHHKAHASEHPCTDDAEEKKMRNVGTDSKEDAAVAGTPTTGSETSATSLVAKGFFKCSAHSTSAPPSQCDRSQLWVKCNPSSTQADGSSGHEHRFTDSASPPAHDNKQNALCLTSDRSGNELNEAAVRASTEQVSISPTCNSIPPRLSTPSRSHGEMCTFTLNHTATSKGHSNVPGGSWQGAGPSSAQSFKHQTGIAPLEATEILFSNPASKSAQNQFATTAQPLHRNSLANSSIQVGNVEDRVQAVRADSGKGGRDSAKDMLENDDYVIYPLNGVHTVPALVEWISSRGASVPQLRKMKEFFACIKSIRQEEKFKRYRELHSAVVTLRRLQGMKADLSAIGSGGNGSRHTSRPSTPSHQQQPDQPLFILLGGGMAAGKTTAVTALAKSSWWESHKEQSVVVNADEFKLPLECEMSSSEAHTHSTRAAENLLVKAINQGRSIVLDGTMMWKPFVQQVVSMVRDAHLKLFKQGPGYDKQTQLENYFIADKARQPALAMPYKIIFLGITVDVETAVPRGFLRKFQTNRGVPISMQLRSFKLFAENFFDYVSLVDETTLYNNNVFVTLEKGELPPVLAECNEKTNRKLVVHDEAAFQQFLRQQQINENADNVLEVYPATPVVP
ncbi:hypothetical protein GH5_01909 [Leishmania sp. Ghana 2012 LV757]|uniref:hypothetical protein n=1 Tax=Leishmania sp. Ghana 2012 LV757 TaxID=2803181 RepID=UPI001B7220A5|nr:hypothetical protein GH5_01909 [Leishmania sp. Ghana 2012 LV757]